MGGGNKGKGKAKGSRAFDYNACLARDHADVSLVWEHREEADPRDPRAAGPPCDKSHMMDQANCRIANQHGVTYKCRVCGIGVLYVPKRGSKGDTRKAAPLAEARTISAKKVDVHGRKVEFLPQAGPGTPPPPSAPWPPAGSDWTWEPADDGEEDQSFPQWDGRAETWTAYQAAVELHLTQKADEEHFQGKPVWDGNPDTWEDYKCDAEEWMMTHETAMLDEQKRKQHGRASSSRMTLGLATPKAFRPKAKALP